MLEKDVPPLMRIAEAEKIIHLTKLKNSFTTFAIQTPSFLLFIPIHTFSWNIISKCVNTATLWYIVVTHCLWIWEGGWFLERKCMQNPCYKYVCLMQADVKHGGNAWQESIYPSLFCTTFYCIVIIIIVTGSKSK